ncbi:MAG: hypothetical protein HY304_02590, partial [candidate division Zixibacteria bacterium]|nr:hypothetical protein [candidate division Zixibacteria bacterium]
MKRWILLAAVAVGLLDGKGIRADNSIVVESKWVAPGATDVAIGVFVSNASPIVALYLPLEIRSVTPGAFIADSLHFELVRGSRVDSSPLGLSGGLPAFIHNYQFRSPAGVQCSGPISGTYSLQNPSNADLISPDAILWTSFVDLDPVPPWPSQLDPGEDPQGTANASLRFRFDVTSTPGVFEIDTCCVVPAIHLSFFDGYFTPILPEFTKSNIEITCCACHGDPRCDGITNIQDVVGTIDVAFRNRAPQREPSCSQVRTDVDCDGVTDIADVIRMVNVAFGGSPNRHSFATPARVRRTTALHFTRRA